MSAHETFNRSAFSQFINAPAGRILRLVAGTGFLVAGYVYRDRPLGLVSMAWSALPLSAGGLDLCYLSAALGGPLSGAKSGDPTEARRAGRGPSARPPTTSRSPERRAATPRGITAHGRERQRALGWAPGRRGGRRRVPPRRSAAFARGRKEYLAGEVRRTGPLSPCGDVPRPAGGRVLTRGDTLPPCSPSTTLGGKR